MARENISSPGQLKCSSTMVHLKKQPFSSSQSVTFWSIEITILKFNSLLLLLLLLSCSWISGSQSLGSPADPLTVLKPQNPSIAVFLRHKIRPLIFSKLVKGLVGPSIKYGYSYSEHNSDSNNWKISSSSNSIVTGLPALLPTERFPT